MRAKNTFSRKHWTVIIFSFLLYYLFSACTTDGMNVITPQLAADRGWDYAYVLSFASLAGCLSVFGQLLFGLLCRKVGPRITIALALAGAAGFMLLYGFAGSIPVYVAALCGLITCSSAHAFVGGSALIANWFPEKKGIASGYASMGTPASTATSVAAFTALFSLLGFKRVMVGMALILLAIGTASFFALRDTPEECGEYPDGAPPREDAPAPAEESAAGDEMPVSKMLRIREMWLTGIMFGFYSIVTTGVMGQFVVRHQEIGIGQAEALGLLTACAVVGLAGSQILGRLENRLGTRTAYRICCAIFCAAILLNFTNIRPLIYVSIVCLGVAITGTPIFLTSFLVSIFGRRHFKTAYAIAYPLSSLIGQTAFLLQSLSLRVFGEMRYAYLLFAGLLAANIVITFFLRMDRWKNV